MRRCALVLAAILAYAAPADAEPRALGDGATVTPLPETSPRHAAHPARGLRIAAGVVLGGAVLAGVGVGALYGTAYHDFEQRRRTCGGTCLPSATEGLRDSLRGRTIAADVLWGIAGAALVADVALWVLDATHRGTLRAHLDGGSVTF
ncbi:MAG: hypothetical protein ABI321_19130 [Polyangia bacterium]